MIVNRKSYILHFFVFIALLSSGIAFIRSPNNSNKIHLHEYSGYFESEESLENLKSGIYQFIVTNQANKNVGFQIQNATTHENLAMVSFKSGEIKSFKIKITNEGCRFRCPITPTKWYQIDCLIPSMTGLDHEKKI